ncbi:hemolysin family protein [Pseudoroseicyclus aestuarii]|uniref:Putative hemolysin n=1 Tax=Pseudoroseicyclus aestuarii TaxID=1795041 RepID=A0A318SUQ2_9RHOB|nr:hemolysin family protein [Pseudoroseicyclus aestuarii]PYE83986.1 putative hemolysin [Pseudoroseicyclus aestuarii]
MLALSITVVLCLIVVNGALAMSELAVVSARSSRLRAMAEDGSRGAQAALELAADSGRFLSSVQIGITMVGVVSGAFSGATLGRPLGAALAGLGVPADWAPTLGTTLVVAVITYLSLIIGELVPKQIALRDPEAVAARIAIPMRWVARIAAPLVWLLDASQDAVLRALGLNQQGEEGVTDEEIRMTIAEAERSGVLKTAERVMIAGVMGIADRRAADLMTPSGQIDVLYLDQSPEQMMERLRGTEHGRLPVLETEDGPVLGILPVRTALTAHDAGTSAEELRALIREAPRVAPETGVLAVIGDLQTAPVHMVLVMDGERLAGAITGMDVLEPIAGTFRDEGSDAPAVIERDMGGHLVAGWMPAEQFAKSFRIELDPEEGSARDFETVAGWVLHRLGGIPQEGQSFEADGRIIEVADMDGMHIDKLLVTRTQPRKPDRRTAPSRRG